MVLLGYGRTGRSGPPAATNTRGVFAGSCEHPLTGRWLRTDALMLSGHSGGPLLTSRGEVVGWSVRSGFDKVLNGDGYYAAGLNEVRPASALHKALLEVLEGRSPQPSIAPGTFQLGAAQAREAAIAALSQALTEVDGAGGSFGSESPASPSSPQQRSPRSTDLESDGFRPPRALHRRKQKGCGGLDMSFGLRSSRLSFSIHISAPSIRSRSRAQPASRQAPTPGSKAGTSDSEAPQPLRKSAFTTTTATTDEDDDGGATDVLSSATTRLLSVLGRTREKLGRSQSQTPDTYAECERAPKTARALEACRLTSDDGAQAAPGPLYRV